LTSHVPGALPVNILTDTNGLSISLEERVFLGLGDLAGALFGQTRCEHSAAILLWVCVEVVTI
jgi:hypothetical protein